MDIKIDDIVTRKSYNNDIKFRVVEIENNIAILRSKEYRLVADAPLEDVEII